MEILQNKSKLKRVDLELFLRFLNVISETIPIGITKLQMKTGVNHIVCVKYIVFLEKFGLVRLITHEKSKEIYITERGKSAILAVTSYFQ
ncbi:MAG: hypothetical protein ACREAR_01570 [Nitrosotalea sp.]